LLHAFLTFAVFLPSLLTFFNVVASLESGARARGGQGLVMWFAKLPWGDPSLAAQVLAMVLFAYGGRGLLVCLLTTPLEGPRQSPRVIAGGKSDVRRPALHGYPSPPRLTRVLMQGVAEPMPWCAPVPMLPRRMPWPEAA
jgi:hypothetical protein